MAYILDANILLRIVQPNHSSYREARFCVETLLRREQFVYILPQVIFEFWVVATRPIVNNGLGLPIAKVKRKVRLAEALFTLVSDNTLIYSEWLRIVETYSVLGLKAHDARIVAAMRIHRVDKLVTYNVQDFKRYHSEITVLSPADVLSSFATT